MREGGKGLGGKDLQVCNYPAFWLLKGCLRRWRNLETFMQQKRNWERKGDRENVLTGRRSGVEYNFPKFRPEVDGRSRVSFRPAT